MIPALLVFEGDRFSFPSIFMDLFFHDFKIWRCPLTPTQWQGMTDPCARFPDDDVLQNHKAQGRRHRGHGRPSAPAPPPLALATTDVVSFSKLPSFQERCVSGTVRP